MKEKSKEQMIKLLLIKDQHLALNETQAGMIVSYLENFFDRYDSRIDQLKKTTKYLRATIAKQEKDNDRILTYCSPCMEYTWAANIVAMLLKCDFRDAKSELKKLRELEEK